MTRDEKGTLYDGEEHIKIIEPIFEDMTKKLMKGFELMASQLRGKLEARVVEVSIMERHTRPFILKNFMIG